MNPVLAFVLTIITVHVGMVIAHFVLTYIVAGTIVASTGKSWMPPDELGRELEKRWLGRFVSNIYPVVFWWLLLWERIVGSDDD